MSVRRLCRCADCLVRPTAGFAPRSYFVKLLKKSFKRTRKVGATVKAPPLSTSHPVFGLKQADVSTPSAHARLLSTSHPVFGKEKALSSRRTFAGPIGLSGFFLSIDPNFACGSNSSMNPNAYVTIRDSNFDRSRPRYQCYLILSGGLKVEALIRMQVGWISPVVKLASVPHVIHLGRGIDVSVPFVFHFTMVSILDELGDNTGSFLYFSGTPWLGFSAGFSRIQGGKMVLNPSRKLDPGADRHDFIGKVHYRQLAFVVFKAMVYVTCILLSLPAFRSMMLSRLPSSLQRHSEDAK